ncbi:TIGR00282 family metallophosphoesterase [Gorillibacterium massiliense]|uniref:TIGR00282 family metallophosphoesterase n=1 Tax=Gorillibacterium massiliense TaxID=1280390 RepID=UPI0004B9C05B|nr:TIGR00282 family metallophosphoesterase [Gorillibacterium massiliense]
MNILFIGDIVGAVGRNALKQQLPSLKTKYRPDIILVNGENAAHGRGITRQIAREFFEWGVHGISMGNHTWDQKEIFDFIDDEPRMVRPANYPPGTPGRGWTTIKGLNGKELVLINLMGRAFLPPLDDPFQKADDILKSLPDRKRPVFVDFHAEATSEKIAMGWHLDGRVAAVVGTHTHVQSHDERVLPGGTAYVTDVGMTGPMNGILGMEKESVLQKFKTSLPVRFVVDEGKWHFHGVAVETDDATGLAKSIKLIRLNEDQFIME